MEEAHRAQDSDGDLTGSTITDVDGRGAGYLARTIGYLILNSVSSDLKVSECYAASDF
jgi:hypothetical protein